MTNAVGSITHFDCKLVPKEIIHLLYINIDKCCILDFYFPSAIYLVLIWISQLNCWEPLYPLDVYTYYKIIVYINKVIFYSLLTTKA